MKELYLPLYLSCAIYDDNKNVNQIPFSKNTENPRAIQSSNLTVHKLGMCLRHKELEIARVMKIIVF